ncbi:MAG: SGNH/GDSL hydrolase family protein [Chloroflexi bacterium]|nr:SGNH/GDSL hydrolase family protein [Chloroflexota bacterium]
MAWQHYVAIGDSLTAGTGDPVPGIEHLSWSDRLAAALGQLHPGFEYHNLAVRGKTTGDMLAEQLPAALGLRPDLVSILAGGNDVRSPSWTPEHYRANLIRLVEPFMAFDTTLFLVAMIDNWASLPTGIRERQRPLYDRIAQVNQVVREVARDYGLLLVDLERVEALHGMEMISADFVHANSFGYIRIAAEVARQLAAQTGALIQHESLDFPDLALEKHRVFREMLHQFEAPAATIQEFVS